MISWLKSNKGKNFQMALDVAVSLLLLMWLLKKNKIIN